MVWNIIVRVVTRYAPFVTLPVAGVIGYIGYNLENLLSDKYTPFSESIQEKRTARLTSDDKLENASKVDKLMVSKGGVLDTNLSPSLQKEAQ